MQEYRLKRWDGGARGSGKLEESRALPGAAADRPWQRPPDSHWRGRSGSTVARAAAIPEEIAFRGVLLASLPRRFARLPAMLMMDVVFTGGMALS
jgi:hypothetical protein